MVKLDDYLPGGERAGALVKDESDPEYLRLLAEEEEIEARVRGAALRVGDRAVAAFVPNVESYNGQMCTVTDVEQTSTEHGYHYTGEFVHLHTGRPYSLVFRPVGVPAKGFGYEKYGDRDEVTPTPSVDEFDLNEFENGDVVEVTASYPESEKDENHTDYNGKKARVINIDPNDVDSYPLEVEFEDEEQSWIHRAVKIDEPWDEREFAVGDEVRCGEMPSGLGTIVRVDENDDDLPYLVRDSEGDSEDWVAADGISAVTAANEAATDRPTEGDLIVLSSTPTATSGYDITFPQVVLIDRDDHDGAPYWCSLLLDDGTQSWFYIREDECSKYEGDRPSTDAPFLLEKKSREFAVGDEVECPQLPSGFGVIVGVDEDDDVLPYRVQDRDNDDRSDWVTADAVSTIEGDAVEQADAAAAWVTERHEAWAAYEAAKRKLYLLLVEDYSNPGALPTQKALARHLVTRHSPNGQTTNAIHVIKDLRWIMREAEGVALGLKEAKELVEQVIKEQREQDD